MRSCPRSSTDNPDPGEWAPILHHDRYTAMVACPQCGKRCSLKDHIIDSNGFVTTMVSHTCGWQQRLVLERWRG